MSDNKNPHNLQIGKSYWFKYTPCDMPWFKAQVTRFTDQGYPWAGTGIISGEFYEVVECTPTKELEEKARAWLNKKGYLGFAEHTPVAVWMSEFAIELSPNILKNSA